MRIHRVSKNELGEEANMIGPVSSIGFVRRSESRRGCPKRKVKQEVDCAEFGCYVQFLRCTYVLIEFKRPTPLFFRLEIDFQFESKHHWSPVSQAHSFYLDSLESLVVPYFFQKLAAEHFLYLARGKSTRRQQHVLFFP